MALPGTPPLVGQLINGSAFSFSSIEVVAGAQAFTNIQSLNYTDELEPGELRGASSKVQGRTRGEYSASGSMALYKPDVQTLLATLAALGQGGYMEAVFDITAVYREGVAAIVTDSLIGCRITSIEDDHSTGNEALQVTLNLHIMELARNGLSATSGGASAAGAAAAIGGAIGGSL